MSFTKFSFYIVAGVLAFSSFSPAQESDYNDVLKQTLKEDTPPTPPPKRIVRKKIKKVVKRSGLPAKTTKVAQNANSAVGTIAVKTKESTEAIVIKPNTVTSVNESEVANAPTLGEVESNSQKYGVQAQQQPYQPIFILPAAPAAPTVAGLGQVQATTNVDSTALPEPKSEQLRHQREDMEHQTENKLIEKLEDDRLKSEKERADKLFAPVPLAAAIPVAPVTVLAANPGVVAVEVSPQVAPIAAPQPVVVVNPAPDVPKTDVTPVIVVDDTLKGQSDLKIIETDVKKDDEEKRMSIGAVAGLPSYPGATNIQPFYTVGMMANYKFESRFALQTAFDYSKFNITNATYCPYCFGGTLIKGLDQFDFNIGITYNILPGKITPVVGVLVDYARRSYNDKVNYGYTYTSDSTGSNAFNAGVMAGVDVTLAKNLILGFQFAYLWNVNYWTDDPLAYGLYGNLYGNPVETLSYYIGTLNVRFLF